MADVDNLKIQLEINEAIEARLKLQTKQASLIEDQLNLALQLKETLNNNGLNDVIENLNEIRAGLDAAEKSAKNTVSTFELLNSGLSDAAKNSNDFYHSLYDTDEELSALEKSFNFLFKLTASGFHNMFVKSKLLITTFSDLGNSAFQIGKSLLAPFVEIFDIIMNKAAELASAGYEIAVAKEEVRKQFGDIGRGFSKQVIDATQDMSKELKASGLSIGRVFGLGPGGTAAAIRESLSMAVALGPAVNLLGRKFKDAAGDLLVFKKGLGLSDEDMRALINHSKAMGTDFNREMTKMANVAEDLADKFGISQKDIARDMAFLTTQSGKFGRLTKEQMATASVSVRSFGLELKDVVGIMDQFADFETAATNASKLAQSFGAIIDPMRMMKEENPAKQFEYLRQQMLQAGASAENMNKAQIKQLATLTGMDENLVRTAFSASNVGKSYEEIQKEADKSGQKQKTQAEIFEKLGKNIERVIEQLQHSGSFMQEFITGFGEGVSRAGPMRQVLHDIGGALIAVRHAGRLVGDVFVHAFPGVKTMLGALHDFFGDGKFKNVISEFTVALSNLFVSLEGDPSTALEDFKKKINDFFDQLSGDGAAGSKLMSGLKSFAKTIGAIFKFLIKEIGEQLTLGIKQITNFIKNPEIPTEAQGFFSSVIMPIINQISDSAMEIGAALIDLIKVVWEKHGDKIMSLMFDFFIFGVAKAAVKGIATSFWSSITSIFAGGGATGAAGAAGNAGKKMITRFSTGMEAAIPGLSKVLGVFSKVAGPVAIGVLVAQAGSKMSEMSETVGRELKKSYGEAAMQAGVGAAGIIDALTFGLMSDNVINSIAKFTAEIKAKFDTMLDDMGLTGFKNTFNGYLKNIFGMFTGFGEWISGIFGSSGIDNLDSDTLKASEGLEKLFDSIFSFVWDGIISTFTEMIPNFFSAVMGIVKNVIIWTFTDGLKYLAIFLASIGNLIVSKVNKAIEWFNNNDMNQVWAGIVDGAIDGLSSIFVFLGKWLDDILTAFTTYWGINSPSTVMAELGGFMVDGLMSTLSELSTKIWDLMNEAWTYISDFLNFDKFSSLGKNVLEGFMSGVSNMSTKVGEIGSGVIVSLKDVFGIHSPSKEAEDIGGFFTDGLLNGLDDLNSKLLGIFDGTVATVSGSFKAGFEKIASEISNSITNVMQIAASALNSTGTMKGMMSGIQILENLSATMNSFKAAYTEGIVKVLVDATADIKELDELLSRLDVTPMDVVIDKLSNKLQVHRDKIEMEHKPINITINMGVTFKAEEFVNDIFKVANSQVKKGNKEVKDLITKFNDPAYSPDNNLYDGMYNGQKYT